MTPDPRDAALQATCPCVAVPRFGRLPQAGQGQRVLVARNGVFAEVTRPWLHSVLKLTELPQAPPLPYGDMHEGIEFSFGVIPTRCWTSSWHMAAQTCPTR
jgi:PRTRC genetic system protein A